MSQFQTVEPVKQIEMFEVKALTLPMKKEFVTTWSMCGVVVESIFSTWSQVFFGHWHQGGRQMVFPEHVRMNQLLPFVGRKTKITIEVID